LTLLSFFFPDPTTTEIYTLSLHDALPIWLLMPCKKKYRWQKTYDSVLHESDPARRLPLIERTVAELERRFAELGDDPATAVELNAIFKATSTLRRRFSRMQQTNLLQGSTQRSVPSW